MSEKSKQPTSITFPVRRLQHSFSHAKDFGIMGNWNSVNRQLFEDAIQQHVQDAPTQITGTYRGRIPVMHYFDAATTLWVAIDQDGKFVAGWALSKKQIEYLFGKGNVQ
ncbi:MAG: colicin D domain-containing protein [Chloroflexota bacterium]